MTLIFTGFQYVLTPIKHVFQYLRLRLRTLDQLGVSVTSG